MKKEGGLDTLMKFLDKKLKKDDLAGSWEKGQSIIDFIFKLDQKYNKIAQKNMTLSPNILAFKLWKCANLSKDELMYH